MYKELHIKNFRCFKDITLTDFGNINIISGKNNVGKTAFLEALWFHHGSPNPELGLRLNAFRGIEVISRNEPLIELFRNLNYEYAIEFKSKDLNNKVRSDKISVIEPQRLTVRKEDQPKTRSDIIDTDESREKAVIIEYTDERGGTGKSKAFFKKDTIEFDRPQKAKRSSAILVLASMPFANEDLDWLGRIEISKEKRALINYLKIIEPRLKDITLILRGEKNEIWCDTGLDRLIPLSVMGSGLFHLLKIIISISRCENGIVLIDEVDTGLHYSVMRNLWATIAKAAFENKVQVFATTHSLDCVRYANEFFARRRRCKTKFYRLEKDNGTIRAFDYDMNTLKTALEVGMEFR